jgi:hypothetical protein
LRIFWVKLAFRPGKAIFLAISSNLLLLNNGAAAEVYSVFFCVLVPTVATPKLYSNAGFIAIIQTGVLPPNTQFADMARNQYFCVQFNNRLKGYICGK